MGPADAGSKMLVTANGHDHGTVGGGKIEARAITEAQSMLQNKAHTHFVDWNLKADIGMTCGGRVRLFFEHFDTAAWNIVVFGAGHVTAALAKLLADLPCRLTCIDPRPHWLNKLPQSIDTICTDDPPEQVETLSEDSFVLCMTRGHSADRPVLQKIFELKKNFAYLGVIGSAAKKATLHHELRSTGIEENRINFHCPVGLKIGSNHPAEIAISITAQLLQVRDQLGHKKAQKDQKKN